MIIDTLSNLEKYVSLNPLIQEVVNFLKSNRLETLADGKHPIKGDDVFVNVQTLKGKTCEEAPMEYHRQMTDIQVPISAAETYGYIPVERMPDAEYDENTDMVLVPGVEAQSFVTAEPGQFIIFMPQDGHAPGISDQAVLRKAIFKIRA